MKHKNKVTTLLWVVKDNKGNIISTNSQEFDTGLHARHADNALRDEVEQSGCGYWSYVVIYEDSDLAQ